MVNRTQQSAQSVTDETNISTDIRRSAISLAVAAALPGAAMTMPNIAVAQDDEMPGDGAIEEIVTVGIRTSVLDSVNTKRMGDTISDVVDAGALGSLPDQSIADALGRVPGVTTVRDSGQSSQLNIRGMNGDFIQTTLNGREQASTAGYTTNTRWMSFDQYPSELINQAAVYKSPKASQLEGGVAGIVDLRTADPIKAQKQHNFVLNARLSQNSAADDFGGDETGGRFSASYQGKFAEETLGVAVGYSYLEQPNAFIMSRVGADDGDFIGYTNTDITGDGNPENVPRAFQWQAGTGTDERTGILASMVWEPTDTIRAQLDYFHSEFDRGDERTGITASGLIRGDGSTSVYNNVNVNSSGLVTGATVNAVDTALPNKDHPWFEARTEDQTTTAESDTIGINLRWFPTDRSTLTFDAYTSEGEKTRKDRIGTMHAYQFGDDGAGNTTYQEIPGQALTYQLNGQNIISANFSGVDFTDTNTMRLSRYEEYPHLYQDKIDAFKLDFKQDVDWGAVSSVEAGVRISDREFESDRAAWLYGARSGQFSDGTTSWCEDNFSTIACEPQSVDGFTAVQSLQGVPDYLVITDLDGLATSIFGAGNYSGIDVYSHDWTFINDNVISEETEAFYLMANLDFNWGDVPVRGNIGVRYIRSDVKSTGFQNVGAGNGTTIVDDLGNSNDIFLFNSRGPEFSDTLPSLNLNFEITEQDIVRFAAAKVMARPPVGQMTGSAGSWSSGTEYNVWTDGSPYLDPFRANQIDISYEHYFDEGGAVTAAVFWKDIESLVEGPTQFTGIDPNDIGVIVPPGQTLNIYQTFLNNDKGGYIRGIELAGTKTFDTLPGIWGGLGATASYSFTESETEVGGGQFYGENLPLPGLSENVWSATVFWDYDNWSAHVNMRYRDEFILNLPIPGSATPTLTKDYTTVDAQMSYAFDNGISVVLSGNNLTDEANIIEYGIAGGAGEYKSFGRQYYLGVNFVY